MVHYYQPLIQYNQALCCLTIIVLLCIIIIKVLCVCFGYLLPSIVTITKSLFNDINNYSNNVNNWVIVDNIIGYTMTYLVIIVTKLIQDTQIVHLDAHWLLPTHELQRISRNYSDESKYRIIWFTQLVE